MKYNADNPPLCCMLTQSTCYQGTTILPRINGILWHCTGANNPNLKRYVQPSDNAFDKDIMLDLLGVNPNKNDWNHIKKSAGVNAFIGRLKNGEVAAVQTLPWNFKPWGCADGKNGSCNNGWIQFEICEDDLTNAKYFEQAYTEAVELTAYLCKLYSIDPLGYTTYNGVKVPNILCHQDSYRLGLGSNHSDVYNWFDRYGKTMDDVRCDVATLMGIEPEPGEVIELDERQTLLIVRTIGKGDTGADVAMWQGLLRQADFDCGVPDGDFGAKTEKATKAFQRAHNLLADGIAGVNSWAAMAPGLIVTVPAPPVIESDN